MTGALADRLKDFASRAWSAALLIAAGAACGRPAPVTDSPHRWFEDVTGRAHLEYTSTVALPEPYFFPALMGGGAAVLDYNNDGRLDVFFAPDGEKGFGTGARLFRQQPDHTFEDVTTAAGVGIFGYGQGVAVGDVNNDGWLDLFVTGYMRVWLFLNNGNQTFTEIAARAGIDNPVWGTSTAFVDYDRDGWLDLVVANYVGYDTSKACYSSAGTTDFCSPSSFVGTLSRLFRNRGASGVSSPTRVAFEDVTVKSGIARAPGPALGVVCADVDGDRWQDILIVNDGAANHLWMNQRNGTFKEEGLFRGVGVNAMGGAEANMGIAIGDIDANGLFDLFVTHLPTETHRLWKQIKRGEFADRTAEARLAGIRSTGFGTAFADVDQDGAEDLVVINGRVSRPGNVPVATSPASFWTPYQERNILYRNDGPGTFTDVSRANPAFHDPLGVHRAGAVADFDNDGALDLLVTRIDGPARLYRNVATGRGHWLMVRMIDPVLNRDAYGAELTISAGGRRWHRWINPAYSYLSSNDARAHVGLGAVDRVDEFFVVWPDGREERFEGALADRVVTLRKGSGRIMSSAPPDGPAPAIGRTRRWRFRAGAALIVASAALLAPSGYSLWVRLITPDPPEIESGLTEPMVAEAIQAARREVVARPRDAAAWGELGMVLHAHVLPVEAKVCYAQAEKLDARNPLWPYLTAALESDPTDRIRDLRRALERPGVDPVVLVALAEAVLAEGQEDTAKGMFTEALRIDRVSARAHLGLARVAMAHGDAEAAVSHVNQCISRTGFIPPAAKLLAEAYFKLGRPDRAAEASRRAPATALHAWADPYLDQVMARSTGLVGIPQRATALLHAGRGEEGQRMLEALLQRYPDSSRAQAHLGRMLVLRGQFVAAEPRLRSVLALEPRHIDARYYLAIALMEQKRCADAVPEFRLVAERQPDYGQTLRRLGLCLYTLEDKDGAARALQEAVRYAPNDITAHENLGIVLSELGRFDEAIAPLERAAALAPSDSHLASLLVRARAKARKPS